MFVGMLPIKAFVIGDCDVIASYKLNQVKTRILIYVKIKIIKLQMLLYLIKKIVALSISII